MYLQILSYGLKGGECDGRIDGKSLKEDLKKGDCNDEDSFVVLRYGCMDRERDFFVPIERVAGITEFSYEQHMYVDLNAYKPDIKLAEDIPWSLIYDSVLHEGEYSTNYCFYDVISKVLYRKCKERGFLWKRLDVCHNSIEGSFVFGALKAKEGSPIYIDWEYVSHKAGGLNNIGGGLMVSASVGVQRSLYYEHGKLMRKKAADFGTVFENKEDSVVTNAFIYHDFFKKVRGKRNITMDMEGEEWSAVLLSSEPIKDKKDLRDDNWCVGFMKDNCMQIPKMVFKDIQKPLKIQGEVIPMSIDTAVGTSKVFFKIRNIVTT